MSAIDPATIAVTVEQRQADRQAQAGRGLRTALMNSQLITRGSGAPGTTVKTPFYIDETNLRFYVYVVGGASPGWHYTALT